MIQLERARLAALLRDAEQALAHPTKVDADTRRCIEMDLLETAAAVEARQQIEE